MWPNQQFPANLVTFTEEIFNGKLHFLCSQLEEKQQDMNVFTLFYMIAYYIKSLHYIIFHYIILYYINGFIHISTEVGDV